MCCLVHQYCSNGLPNAISKALHCPTACNYSINTRSNNLFRVTPCKTQHGKLLHKNYCYHLWQWLSQAVESTTSFKSFKSKLKKNFSTIILSWVCIVLFVCLFPGGGGLISIQSRAVMQFSLFIQYRSYVWICRTASLNCTCILSKTYANNFYTEIIKPSFQCK